MRPFNLVPFVLVGTFILLVLLVKVPLPPWLWLAIFVVIVLVYGPVADAIVWRLYRKEREAEVAAQTAIVDASWRRIEENHGVSGRERAVSLAMKELRHGLTREEKAELLILCGERVAANLASA